MLKRRNEIIITTTPEIQGAEITRYIGLARGIGIIGVNIGRDFMAFFRDIVGGPVGAYEKGLNSAEERALDDMVAHAKEIGATAVVGVNFDHDAIGPNGTIVMATILGTAVQHRQIET